MLHSRRYSRCRALSPATLYAPRATRPRKLSLRELATRQAHRAHAPPCAPPVLQKSSTARSTSRAVPPHHQEIQGDGRALYQPASSADIPSRRCAGSAQRQTERIAGTASETMLPERRRRGLSGSLSPGPPSPALACNTGGAASHRASTKRLFSPPPPILATPGRGEVHADQWLLDYRPPGIPGALRRPSLPPIRRRCGTRPSTTATVWRPPSLATSRSLACAPDLRSCELTIHRIDGRREARCFDRTQPRIRPRRETCGGMLNSYLRTGTPSQTSLSGTFAL